MCRTAIALTLASAGAGSVGIRKVLPKLFLCDGQGPFRGAILYEDRSCCLPSQWWPILKELSPQVQILSIKSRLIDPAL